MSSTKAPSPPSNVVTGVIKAMRPRQWVKNLLVLAAPLAALGVDKEYDYKQVFINVGIAFVVFSLAASSIYLVNDALKEQGWRMNSLQLPPALHFCITRPNTHDGVAEQFLAALAVAVAYAEEHRGEPAQSGAMYGFGHTPQGHATLETVMSGVLDAMHDVAPEA